MYLAEFSVNKVASYQGKLPYKYFSGRDQKGKYLLKFRKVKKKLLQNSSAERQKGESQNGCCEKKHAKLFEERTFLTPLCTHVRVCLLEGKKCLFFRKFNVLYLML